MREIKFRAWDKFNDCLWFSNNSLTQFFALIDDLRNGGNEIIIEQFTGLLDKNGKEIFEGDIMRVKGTKRVGEYITKIIYDAPLFKLETNKTYLHDYAAIRHIGEIIGNIHENPDLLKQDA